MKRILALLAALALSVHPTLAETSVAPEVTPTPGAAAIASPTASPTPEPAGTLYDCTDFRVRLSDDLAPLDDEALAGYAAAVGSAYPDAAEMRLVAADAEVEAVIGFALAPSQQSAVDAAREAAATILGSDAGVVETSFGANECACFACAIEDLTFHMYFFSLGDQLLTVTASGLEDTDLAAVLESLEF